MEKVREVGPKNLRKNFRAEELFSKRNISRYSISRSRKGLVMSIPKRDTFMQLF